MERAEQSPPVPRLWGEYRQRGKARCRLCRSETERQPPLTVPLWRLFPGLFFSVFSLHFAFPARWRHGRAEAWRKRAPAPPRGARETGGGGGRGHGEGGDGAEPQPGEGAVGPGRARGGCNNQEGGWGPGAGASPSSSAWGCGAAESGVRSGADGEGPGR